MTWERRPNNRRYYYRSRKRNGKTVKTYIGTGAKAEQAAQLDALNRAIRNTRIQSRRAAQARQKEMDEPLVKLCWLSDLLMKAALVSEGYYQHDGGQWRKRRQAIDGHN